MAPGSSMRLRVAVQISDTETRAPSNKLAYVPKPCVFCGRAETLTNAHVLSQPIRAAFSDPSVSGSFVYRQSSTAAALGAVSWAKFRSSQMALTQ